MKKKSLIVVFMLLIFCILLIVIFKNVDNKSKEEREKVDLTKFLSNYKIDDSRSHQEFATTYVYDSENTIFKTKENGEDVYFFAGSNPNNWVHFAGFYWRIIRTNENGSVRVIYNGLTKEQEGESTQIGTSTFNGSEFDSSSFQDPKYVGYMVDEESSNVKKMLDSWYEYNLKNYIQYIDETSGFCGDQTIASEENMTLFAPFERANIDLHKVSLDCPDEYYYTTKNSSKGNHKLTYPIGLITSDEVVFAGGFHGESNESYYLHTKNWYWTMSPSRFDKNAYVFYVLEDGSLRSNFSISNKGGVRPVINLKASILENGDGSKENPYQLK